MSTKTEALAIAELAIDLTNANPKQAVHCCVSGGSVSVTVFNELNDVAWQENLYDWSHDEAYLPKLRWLRNELEQMLEAAVAEKEKVAA